MPALIYKIVPAALWRQAEAARSFPGSPVDLADGFIHLSASDQVEATAQRHYAHQADLLLVAVSAEALGPALRWETSRGGARFPHLYGPLALEHVVWAKPLPLDPDGGHVFEALLP